MQLSSGRCLWAVVNGLNITPELQALPPLVSSESLDGGEPRRLYHWLVWPQPWLPGESVFTHVQGDG